MAKPDVLGAPNQQTMDSKVEEAFRDKNSLLVQQTMRGCLQECLGCEAKSEYKLSDFDTKWLDGYTVSEEATGQPNIMYALEQSSCCCRLFWRDGRPFDMKLSEGGESGGQEIVTFHKPCSMPLYVSIPATREGGTIDCPCCCMLPSVETMLPGGAPLGNKSKYICDINLCVPKLSYSEGGEQVYILKPETCCGGCCIACNCCSGKGLIYIPFYFHEPGSMTVVGGDYEGNGTPQIRKVWAGMKKECCSTADTFAVIFPQGINANRKAGILGLTFLLGFTVFERQNER
mmetsp:Transcript_43073/g.119116  ORF Transcript_43073/g.119116 Transcript_43073/m.119116 type:complete len:288 (-) Transcript_43073:159-1022(-)